MDTSTQPRQPLQGPSQPSKPRSERADSRPAENPGREQEREASPSFVETLRRHWIAATAVALVIVAALVGGAGYWLESRHYESTDDAFIAARSFSIAPKVSGYVTAVPVTDNQHVAAGDVLARIDPRDYQIATAQAQAQVDGANASIDNINAQITSQQAQIEQAKAQVEQAEAQLKFAQEEAARAQDLVAKGSGTVQRQQQTNSDLTSQQANTARARSALIAAQLQIKVLDAQKNGAQAQLNQAKAQLDQAKLNLGYTEVTAAQPGRVVKLSAASGAYVNAGQSLMMLVPDDVWIIANYKETQLADMRPGQPVDVRIDAYPQIMLHGRVASVQPGSGTAFSLLPAENATGNYVKVVQRVPVKIVIDKWPDGLPVGPGMSVVPWTRVR